MATLSDLKIPSILSIPHSEAINIIIAIRENRRIKKANKRSKPKKLPELSPQQALEVLKILGVFQ